MTDLALAGPLEVDGCFNLRDAGGWPTTDGRRMRTGLLYRADEPARMTAAGRTVVDGIGLQAVIDLRSRRQFERGSGFGHATITHHVPVLDRVLATDEPRRVDAPADIARLYHEMVELQRPNVVRAFELIAAHVGDGPVLVHCTAGKDRTGIVVGLVQAAIGVPLDAIVEDYARSDGPTRLRRTEMLAHPLPGDPDVASAPELIWTAPAEAMELFVVQSVERSGSLEAWPGAIGVSPGTVAALRRHLLA